MLIKRNGLISARRCSKVVNGTRAEAVHETGRLDEYSVGRTQPCYAAGTGAPGGHFFRHDRITWRV